MWLLPHISRTSHSWKICEKKLTNNDFRLQSSLSPKVTFDFVSLLMQIFGDSRPFGQQFADCTGIHSVGDHLIITSARRRVGDCGQKMAIFADFQYDLC